MIAIMEKTVKTTNKTLRRILSGERFGYKELYRTDRIDYKYCIDPHEKGGYTCKAIYLFSDGHEGGSLLTEFMGVEIKRGRIYLHVKKGNFGAQHLVDYSRVIFLDDNNKPKI